jgi:hypothetical protein
VMKVFLRICSCAVHTLVIPVVVMVVVITAKL